MSGTARQFTASPRMTEGEQSLARTGEVPAGVEDTAEQSTIAHGDSAHSTILEQSS